MCCYPHRWGYITAPFGSPFLKNCSHHTLTHSFILSRQTRLHQDIIPLQQNTIKHQYLHRKNERGRSISRFHQSVGLPALPTMHQLEIRSKDGRHASQPRTTGSIPIVIPNGLSRCRILRNLAGFIQTGSPSGIILFQWRFFLGILLSRQWIAISKTILLCGKCYDLRARCNILIIAPLGSAETGGSGEQKRGWEIVFCEDGIVKEGG